jgi:hypothetical protein
MHQPQSLGSQIVHLLLMRILQRFSARLRFHAAHGGIDHAAERQRFRRIGDAVTKVFQLIETGVQKTFEIARVGLSRLWREAIHATPLQGNASASG